MVLNNNDGLILFEGPTGSGKSTLQAALVNEVNKTQARHIYTLEDPIEFVHTSANSLVTQREIHTDVDSFFQGLQTAKRSKPGIILLGELRDPVTKRAALESAGEGHLVLATSHASSVPEAIATFVGAFPSDEQNDVSQRLAVSLRGVITQQLVPSTDGRVVPMREMLSVTPVIASKLRDREAGDLRGVLMSSEARQQPGTFSRDDDLLKLVLQGKVEPEVAISRAISANELRERIGANR
jgi:twitching motility protein PilT